MRTVDHCSQSICSSHMLLLSGSFRLQEGEPCGSGQPHRCWGSFMAGARAQVVLGRRDRVPTGRGSWLYSVWLPKACPCRPFEESCDHLALSWCLCSHGGSLGRYQF